MDTREKLNEFAELRGWNKNKPIGWSEAADFGDWLTKKEWLKLKSDYPIEANMDESDIKEVDAYFGLS